MADHLAETTVALPCPAGSFFVWSHYMEPSASGVYPTSTRARADLPSFRCARDPGGRPTYMGAPRRPIRYPWGLAMAGPPAASTKDELLRELRRCAAWEDGPGAVAAA